jgi:hypothetical protein
MLINRNSLLLPLLLFAGITSTTTMAQGGIPANDFCTNVVPEALAIGGSLTFAGDNTNATFTGDAAPGTVLAQYPAPNTWHAFTTTACSKVTVSYCGTASGWSNVWKLLSTDCPADSLIGASVSDTTTCANHNWTFTFNSLAVGTYYLPVPKFGFGQGGGPYTIQVSATNCAGQPPANDLCTNVVAQALTNGSSLTFTGDNTYATFAGDAAPGTILAQYPAPNTWHAFTTNDCSDVTVSYCGTDSGWSNIWRLLSTNCPADSLINATVSDTTTCTNHNWTFTFSSLAAGTYYLPVPKFGFGQGGGAYSITVSAAACANGTPTNDLCSGTTALALGVGGSLTFVGNNTNATFAGDAVPGSLLDQYPFPNTWHAFTTTECSRVTVSYCGTDSGWSNVWKLLTTQCPADSVVQASTSNTTDCGNGNWTFSFNNLPAGTYYLPVPNVGFGQGGGAYSIVVTASGCTGIAPSNDLCSAVTPVDLTTGSSINFNGDNTSATFAGDAAPGTLLSQFPSPNTWHAFTTTACNNVTVSYCTTDSGWSNVWKLLATDCPADSLINATTSDTTSCANGNWTFTFVDLAAGTYYLPVPNVGFGQGGGVYHIQVSAATCSNAAPANDLCSAVTPVTLGIGSPITFSGNNTNATFAGDAEAGSLLAQYPFPNTWHAFTTSDCANVTVSYCTTDSGWSNVWRLLTVQCPADSLINASNADTTTCANGNWTFTFDTLAAGTYYLPVPNVGFGQGGGAYSITVNASVCTVDIPEQLAQGNWTLYPNPTRGELTIAFTTDQGIGRMELMDLTGRVLLDRPISASGQLHLDLGNKLAPGAYLVQLTMAKGRSQKRVVIR